MYRTIEVIVHDRVKLNGGKVGPLPQLWRHGRDEVADTGGGLDDAGPLQAAEAELEDGLPDRGTTSSGV
jgi:hypothetical protein